MDVACVVTVADAGCRIASAAGCRVTVTLRVAFAPAASVAVTPMTFTPALSGTAAIVHRAVPAAVPEGPRSLCHVTATAFDAVPDIATDAAEVVTAADAGSRIASPPPAASP